jgi:CRP-like cAMP-binding protein
MTGASGGAAGLGWPQAADLGGHAFLHGLAAAQVAVLERDSRQVTWPAGHRIFDEGAAATKLWLIQDGLVALDVHVPGRNRLLVETLGQGDLLGLSWLRPPYQWQFGAVAVHDTDAFELDAVAVRGACEADPELGYQLLCRVLTAASARLHGARIRILDLYAAVGPAEGSS